MATTIRVTESAPSAYPEVERLPDAISAADPAAVWQRIEAYIAWRWNTRPAIFTVEGPGEWTPPLQPAAITRVDLWIDDAWVQVSPRPTPLGGIFLDQVAVYRIEATVGEDAPPPGAVKEAFRRLLTFSSGVLAFEGISGAVTSRSEKGLVSERSVELTSGWAAKALQLSGAADLLRPWRRLGPA